MILREQLVATGWKSGILFLQINVFVGLLVDFPVAMVVRDTMADFTVGQYITMPHLGLSGLRIRYLLGPVRPSWVNNVLSSGYTTPLALRLNTIMGIMVLFIRGVPPGVFREEAVAIFLGCGSAASEFKG